jgi:PAS domain S-box-containing protein
MELPPVLLSGNWLRTPDLLIVMGALMIFSVAWAWMLRQQVRAKTAEMREWLRREAALKERYRDLLENAIDIVYTRDLEGNITSLNNTGQRVLGYTPEEARGLNLTRLVAPEYRELVRQALDAARAGREPTDCEVEVVTKYGVRMTLEIRGRLLFEGGKVAGVQAIARDITQRKRVEEQVSLQAAALEAAEEANRAKSQFLTNMSHELRTPLNAVIGMTDLALATELGSEQRNYLEVIGASGTSLLKLIEQILDFSKLEAGNLELASAPLVLEDVVDQALRPLALQAYGKGLEMAWGLDPAIPPSLRGDAARLKQVLVNLVENAVKFTEKGEVVVRAWADWQKDAAVGLHFAVADTGVGIPSDKLALVFGAFTQADGSLSRRFAGAGLGLAICAELARMMGGSICVDSGPGRGSTFHLTLRLDLCDAAPGPRDERVNKLLREVPVLLLEHHPATREILVDMLRSRGMLPTAAEDPEQALARLREAQRSGPPFRLVLSDAQFAGARGLAWVKHLRGMLEPRAAVILLLPPTQAAPDAGRRRELGIFGHCTKPLRESEVVSVIVNALESPASAISRPLMPGSSEQLGHSWQVLLAESNEVTQVLMTHMLEKRGHRVAVAADGMQVLSALRESVPPGFDLVLMEMELPLVNGVELTGAIREFERETARRVPILAMTGHPVPGEEESCKAAGMEGCLAKPVQAAALFEAIQRIATRDGHRAPVETPAATVFDRSTLLSRLEGDETLGGEIIEMFLAEYPELLAGVRQAAEQRDAYRLERAAHALKGSAGDIAAMEAFAAARTLEQLAREGKVDDTGPALATLEGALDRLAGVLREVGQKGL